MSIYDITVSDKLGSGNVNVTNTVNAKQVSADDMPNIFNDTGIENVEQEVANQESKESEQSSGFFDNLLHGDGIIAKLAEYVSNLFNGKKDDEVDNTDNDSNSLENQAVDTEETNEDDTKIQEENSSENTADVDGKIDDTEQGNYGDCWLLSGVNSLTTSENGQEIIENMVTDNKDGSYTVDLDGVGKSYTYSADEINEAQDSSDYSSGDGDMAAIELAVQECRDDAVSGKDKDLKSYGEFVEDVNNVTSNTDSLDYGGTCQEFYELAGLDSKIYTKSSSNFEENVNNVLDKIENNSEKYSATMTFTEGDKLTDVNGNKVSMTGKDSAHVWSVDSVDDDNVTIVNPWDSSKTSTFKRSELLKNLADISYAETSD